MKHILAIAWVCILASPVAAVPVEYTLQEDDSVVGFTWFFGQDAVKGTMPVARANILLDLQRLANSQVTVAADVTGAQAGFLFATQGIKSEKVLWADAHPEIIFESTMFKRDGSGATVDGLLTVRGVTRPATFAAKLFRQAGTERGDVSMLSVHLTGSLSRAAYGADGWADLAGDEVRLSIVARMQIADDN